MTRGRRTLVTAAAAVAALIALAVTYLDRGYADTRT